jgi:hypothetical protein
MSKHKVPEGEDGQNLFAEVLAKLDTEQLIRLCVRLQKDGRKKTLRIIQEEIEEREALEKQEHAAAVAKKK